MENKQKIDSEIIFLTAGTGLLAGFYMTKNLDK